MQLKKQTKKEKHVEIQGELFLIVYIFISCFSRVLEGDHASADPNNRKV